MRQGPRTLLALVTFVALAGVWLALERTAEHRSTPAAAEQRLVAAFSPETVTRVAISGPTGAVTLERDKARPDRWTLVLPGRPAADGRRVARLTAAVRGMRLGDRVTDRVSRHAALGVDEATGTQLRLFAGSRPLANFFVGRVIDGHTMVRAANAESVMQAVGDLAALTLPSARPWRDRRILAFAVGDVRKLAIESPAGAFYLERATAASPWRSTSAAPAAPPVPLASVERWLGALSTLKAEGFLDDPEPASLEAFAAPLARVRVWLTAGGAAAQSPRAARVLALSVVRSPHPEEDSYLLRRDDRSQILVISTAKGAVLTGSPLVAPSHR